MGTSEKVPIFAWIVREGGLPVPLHRSPLQDHLGLQGFVYSLKRLPVWEALLRLKTKLKKREAFVIPGLSKELKPLKDFTFQDLPTPLKMTVFWGVSAHRREGLGPPRRLFALMYIRTLFQSRIALYPFIGPPPGGVPKGCPPPFGISPPAGLPFGILPSAGPPSPNGAPSLSG